MAVRPAGRRTIQGLRIPGLSLSAFSGTGGPPDGRRSDALVTDVYSRSSLAGVRALGRAGLRVVALGRQRSDAGVWSRHVVVPAIGPDSFADPGGFAARVGEIAREQGPLVVYPSGEPAIDALLARRDDLPAEAVLPYGDLDGLRALRDKRALRRLARAVGLDAPATLMEATAREVAAAPPPVPFAVKQVLSVGSLRNRTHIVETDAQLARLLGTLAPEEPLLVQERARGPLVGLALVLDREGRVVAWFQQVARRMWPAEAGGSTLAIGVAPDEELAARSARMLAEAGYWGLAQLQFLRTPRGPALIDVNTRFYGSMPLATASGVNLPAAWHAVATGTRPARAGTYRIGVSYRWLEADLTAAFNGAPRRLVARTSRPRAGAVWARDDPVPSCILGAQAIGIRVARRLRIASTV